MARRSGPPSPAKIDREWPHQVALPDDLCAGHSHQIIREFCAAHGLAPVTRSVQAIWADRKEEQWRLHCFSDPDHAALFRNHFRGIEFIPARDREDGRARGAWRREGEYRRILDLGPLSVPEILRN